MCFQPEVGELYGCPDSAEWNCRNVLTQVVEQYECPESGDGTVLIVCVVIQTNSYSSHRKANEKFSQMSQATRSHTTSRD